jgi:peptidoglycan/LPS O-acetylase OafA/YrhL
MQTEPRARFYHPELDGLRFIAFLLVFVNHAPYFTFAPVFKTIHDYGWIGVDLFLCLSAFLITRILLSEHQRCGGISVRQFYIRRILRIWPLYFLGIGLAVIFTIFGNLWNSTTMLRVAGLSTFTDNILAAFLGYNHLSYSTHLWTISYEEQFYMVIPWTMRRIVKLTKRNKLIIIGILVLLGFVIRSTFIYFQVPHPSIWVLPITHFESILGGFILGLGVFEEPSQKHRGFLLCLGLIAVGFITFLPNYEKTSWYLMITYPLTGAGMTLIVSSIVQAKRFRPANLCKTKPVVYLGKISYGLYVYHLASLGIANEICRTAGITSERFIAYPFTMFVTGLIVTFLFSIFSYNTIERKFLMLKERFTLIPSRPI